MTRRIVLDTDMGSDVDDALCLALALAAPELDLVAVTHVSKDTRLRARISKRLLSLAGRSEVPVYAGRGEPISGVDRFVWFGHEGEGILQSGVVPDIETEDAVDALARLFLEEDGLELVAIGPLTNVAAALEREPGLAGRIKQLTVMGGYVRQTGVEYNLCSDPEASLRVLRAGIPTRLVTGDVTMRTWIREADVAEIEACASPLHLALARAVRIWTPMMHRIFGATGEGAEADNAAFLHDPLTLASVYDESFCRFEDLFIEPAIADGVFQTFERDTRVHGVVRMRCATAVDAERFRLHFLGRIKDLAAL